MWVNRCPRDNLALGGITLDLRQICQTNATFAPFLQQILPLFLVEVGRVTSYLLLKCVLLGLVPVIPAS